MKCRFFVHFKFLCRLSGEPLSKFGTFCLNLRSYERQHNDPLEQELNLYIAEALEEDMTLDVLHWWKDRARSYPRLAVVARTYLGIPATQTSSERLFSVAGDIVTETRVNLLPANVEKLAFLHENMSSV